MALNIWKSASDAMKACLKTVIAAVALIAVMVPGMRAGIAGTDVSLPAGKGRDIVYGHCRTCHSLTYLTDSAGISRAQWGSVVRSMHQLGMPKIDTSDREKLLDYLAAYLGPNPPPKNRKAGRADGAGIQSIEGKVVFRRQCASCHQADGKGVPGQFPPLAKNTDIFLSKEFPILVVLNGLEGKIRVEDKVYNSVMPPFDYLSNGKVAAVIRYIRRAWGNDSIRPKDLAEVLPREVGAARRRKLAPREIKDRRNSLRKNLQ
jgi:mono/diheme cytochrome c family protein